jgi:hypothetical protein
VGVSHRRVLGTPSAVKGKESLKKKEDPKKARLRFRFAPHKNGRPQHQQTGDDNKCKK